MRGCDSQAYSKLLGPLGGDDGLNCFYDGDCVDCVLHRDFRGNGFTDDDGR